MKLRLTLAYLFLTICSVAHAANIEGKIIDKSNGQPLPFASLILENTTKGTTSNVDGRFVFNLPSGEYTLQFQYVGYTTKKITLTVDENLPPLTVELEPEVLKLKEVVVKSTDVDPAYAVIRKTIKAKKQIKRSIDAFKCNIYMKGLQSIDEKPDGIMGMNISLDTGIVYLSESLSELSYKRPNHIKEKIISSKVSGSSSSLTFNQGSQALISFYDDLVYFGELSQRGFISPIANNALFSYDYQLVGTFFEGNQLINKIKVLPKRKTDPVFDGHIYIVEDSWQIHSLELTLTRERQLEFFNKLTISQVHAPVANQYWMILSERLDINLNTFGFKGKGYFNIVFSDYQIQPNKQYIKTESNVYDDNHISKNLFSKNYFDGEILGYAENATQKDDHYWESVRPVPLTIQEETDYLQKDSTSQITNSKAYLDSLDKINNKFKLLPFFLSKYSYSNSYTNKHIEVSPMTKLLQYNTVEGAVINLGVLYRVKQIDRSKYTIGADFRYGNSSKNFYSKAEWINHLNRHRFSELIINGGHFIEQYNRNRPITSIINTYETLVNRRNFLKVYERTFFNVYHTRELFNGLKLKGNLNYEQRSQLENTTDFSFFYEDSRDMTPNIPINAERLDTSFDTHEALTSNIQLIYNPGQKFIQLPHRKQITERPNPQFKLSYRSGIAALGSDINWQSIQLSIDDHFSLGLIGNSEAEVIGGKFLSTKDMSFIDFHHTNTNLSILSPLRRNKFQLLDYYFYSTNNYWLEGHYTHHFDGFIIKKLPLLKKTDVQLVSSIHVLRTESLSDYWELGIGLEHIFKIGRIDYVTSPNDASYWRHAIRIGLGI